MLFSKKDKQLINKALDHWKSKELLDDTQAEKLEKSISTKNFDWKSLAFYTSMFGLISLIIAVISIFADEALLELIDSFIESSYLTKSIVGIMLSILFYTLDRRYAGLEQHKTSYSKEVFSLLTAISLAITSGLVCFLFDKEQNPGLIILLLSILYFLLGKVHQKPLYWIFGLSAFLVAYGSITLTFENTSGSFIGMNFPLRFSLIGLLLIMITVSLKRIIQPFYHYTYNIAILIFFTATWILSITGNYNDYNDWLAIRQYELWIYGALLFIASGLAILIGIKQEDSWLKNTGVIFVCINLYTRYFEYFWDSLHKAIFFFIIALSFWLIGKQAEKIWNKET